MNKKILQVARKKFKELAKKYNKFNIVFLDNWRGYRFVYDTDEAKKYRGKNLYKSKLYKLLENEKPDVFSADLYRTSPADKKIFGQNPFLNYRTSRQYRDCYVNFILKKARKKKQIIEELEYIRDLKIIYAKKGNKSKLEKEFRGLVVRKVLERIDKTRGATVLNFVDENNKYFLL